MKSYVKTATAVCLFASFVNVTTASAESSMGQPVSQETIANKLQAKEQAIADRNKEIEKLDAQVAVYVNDSKFQERILAPSAAATAFVPIRFFSTRVGNAIDESLLQFLNNEHALDGMPTDTLKKIRLYFENPANQKELYQYNNLKDLLSRETRSFLSNGERMLISPALNSLVFLLFAGVAIKTGTEDYKDYQKIKELTVKISTLQDLSLIDRGAIETLRSLQKDDGKQ